MIAGATIGLLYTFLNTFEDLDSDNTSGIIIKACITLVQEDITITEPEAIEYDLLTYFSYALGGTFIVACCLIAFFKDSSSFGVCVCCALCGIILAAGGVAALLSHIFMYIYQVNKAFEESSTANCEDNDDWMELYIWAFAGGCIAAGMVGFWCCGCCLYIFVRNEDDDSYDYGGNKTNYNYGGNTGYSGVSSPGSGSYGGSQRAASPAPSNQRAMVVAGSDYGGSNRGGDVQLTSQQKDALARVLISAEVIEKCGFSIASDINKAVLLEVLKRMQPSGQTALRDAIAVGVLKMIKLKAVLAELGVVGHQFIHIVLTDGADNRSETTLRDIQGLYYKIGEELGDKFFKTFFIGIGLGYTEKNELQSIADLAGDAAELHNCSDVQLSDVFDRIKLSLGIERRVAVATDGTNFVAAAQDRLFLQAERQKFLVLFDLDMSGSMGGSRWNRLQGALGGFFQGLDSSDIIGVELFNHTLVTLTGADLNNATA
eukprot:CAMPEP_0201566674 /NCGR_PEP_ID=MMETSP0190_2-20130828/6631_1 /ASSEMBLY_ACC=CAM_ASM_000263 /TAXON_ID=37353 /ORGANISM="Rosalina sp." /LENGTH=486 /DNA_ID=CAMNT_0047985713 /DNA_START=104 /DNA_END=1567 /DNA_ORIENTATION=-